MRADSAGRRGPATGQNRRSNQAVSDGYLAKFTSPTLACSRFAVLLGFKFALIRFACRPHIGLAKPVPSRAQGHLRTQPGPGEFSLLFCPVVADNARKST